MPQTLLIEGRLCVEVSKGVWQEEKRLHWDARTCYEAAMIRNIYLRQELKTLVYNTIKGSIVFHLPGDRRLSTRMIRESYPTLEPMQRGVLINSGLDKGKINPLNIKILANLYKVYICEHVFGLQYVFTNDGSLRGTYIIDTSVIESIYPFVESKVISIPW